MNGSKRFKSLNAKKWIKLILPKGDWGHRCKLCGVKRNLFSSHNFNTTSYL